MKVKHLLAQLNSAEQEGDVWVRIVDEDDNANYYDIDHAEVDPAGNVRLTIEVL